MKLNERIQAAKATGHLLGSTAKNIDSWLTQLKLPDWALSALEELATKEAWGEINDRFYRDLEFGTGGMRGRTIGAVTTASETGTAGPLGTPEHASIGSNLLNDFTLIRATVGLFRYTKSFLQKTEVYDPPKLVIAHDVRHFSRHFCELAASTWTRLGGVAFIFDGPRSTPQLSYSVRWLKAHAGVVVTASHNPPHDNGFKAYFGDGAQVVPPHDNGIVSEVAGVALSELPSFLSKNLERVITLGKSADEAYLAAAATSTLDAEIFKKCRIKAVYTNIHGVGSVMSVPLLQQAGIEVVTVPAQEAFDSRFPTVKSPNPENADALALAVARADEVGADVVMATDPDCDRMGVAVRNRAGKMELLSGNQVGALLAEYRLTRLKDLGWIPRNGSNTVALIKTFVTSPLQDAIGRGHGVKVINTLTGFKWIAAKQLQYEEQLKTELQKKEGFALDYANTPLRRRAELLQTYSTFYAFGDEESYGYLGNDFVRDKDGNAACLMFAELCAWVKSRGLTVPEYLDEIYQRYGFFLEGVINLYYEGATGAAKIKKILDTYRSNPPTAFGETDVAKFEDFGRQTILDADGDAIPKQDLYFVTLANGYSFAARGSGTEPKMKFYLFAQSKAAEVADLSAIKASTHQALDAVKALIEADAKARAEG